MRRWEQSQKRGRSIASHQDKAQYTDSYCNVCVVDEWKLPDFLQMNRVLYFYISRLFSLILFSVSCFPTSWSWVFTIILPCCLLLFFFPAFKTTFYSCDAIPSHQSLIQLLGICQNLNRCHRFPF